MKIFFNLILSSILVSTKAFNKLTPTHTFGRYMSNMNSDIPTTVEGWKAKLTPPQFEILRRKATEPPGYSERTPGELEFILKKSLGTKYPKDGVYECVGCGAKLYSAKSKFDSGCGWPAFDDGIVGAIKEVPDADGRRVEIVCSNCDSHLGVCVNFHI